MSLILLISDCDIPETHRKQNLFSDINAILKFLYFINNSKKSDELMYILLQYLKLLTICEITLFVLTGGHL